MFLRNIALSSIALTAIVAASPQLAEPPVKTPISKDSILELHRGGGAVDALLASIKTAASVIPLSPADVVALKKEGVPDSVIDAYLARQAEDSSRSDAASPSKTAPTRRLRITGQLERVPNLPRRWNKLTKDAVLPWNGEPGAQSVVLLFTSRVSDIGSNSLPGRPEQPVCWCSHGSGCASLRVLSVQGGCGRLETPGDGNWDRHLSSSEWKTLRYGDTFVALDLDMPPTAKVVQLSILANRCSESGSFMFPITSAHSDVSPGFPVPVNLFFSPRDSKDFSASIELRLLTDGMGVFDIELRNVKMDDRDSESRAATEKCIKEHGSGHCRYVSLDEDLDGVSAGVATLDSTSCE